MPEIVQMIMPLGITFLILYFFMVRPQKAREQQAQQMRDSIRVGDRITTVGGIRGDVVEISETEFVLSTSDQQNHIRFLKTAIYKVERDHDDEVDDVVDREDEDKAEG